MALCQASARSAFTPSSSPPWPGPGPADPSAMNARIKAIIAEARFGSSGFYDNSSGGGSSLASSVHSDSDESSSADEFWHDLREVQRYASPLSSSSVRDSIRRITVSSPRALDDDNIKHQQRMLLVLPAFASPATAAARAEALTRWLAGFDVGWVVGASDSLPRREVARKVRAWAQALSAMERLFLLWKPELAAEMVTALGELAVASAGAMLRLVRAVSALDNSPSKLLTALDVYVPVWETYPVLARLFSWGPSHPVLVAAETALADLVDAARRCRRDLRTFIRSHYPWQMPQGGDVHPCVGFWMGYFRCMLRHRVSLYFILGNEDRVAEAAPPPEQSAEGGLSHLVAGLISCLEAVLEEKSAALAAPGLRQVFMLNNTCAIVLHAVGSDLKLFLPPEWVHDHEERMEGCIKGYIAASWAPVVSRLDGGRARTSIIGSGHQNRLKTFCSALENACSAQRCWKVPNPVLRGVLRRNVSEKVVPVYRRFLEDHPEVQVDTGLAAEELEQQLLDLFEG
ncbi:hypothetical protein EJB05_45941, partial [Eragrostis curvula]